MILSVGTDLVALGRIEKAMGRSGFIERILTERERGRALTKEYVGGRWAAKEAVAKCLMGRGSGPLGWHDVEVISGEGGEPLVEVNERVLTSDLGVLVSISHERDYAVAFAVLVRNSMGT